MTRGRYEIEFQGSNDGKNWIAYPFRYKPQALNKAPRIYAPYQPRFDWNLWFASLGSWRDYPIVPNTEVACSRTIRTCSRSSRRILSATNRLARFALCSGNIGLLRWKKNAKPACGGEGRPGPLRAHTRTRSRRPN